MQEETLAGSDPRIAPRLIVPMSLQLVIPRRVALQQSSLPLHQPSFILKEKRKFEKEKSMERHVCQFQTAPLNRSVHPSRLWFIDDRRLGRREPNMMLIGVDYHPSFQTIAFVMEETGECDEQELHHSDGQAEKFYRDLKQRGISVRVGMEATGYARWFER